MSLHIYLSELNGAINSRDGHRVAELLSYQDTNHSRSYQLLNELNDQILPRYVTGQWIDLVSSHVNCCFSLYEDDFVNAYKEITSGFGVLTKILQNAKDENWFLPVLYVMGVDLRLLAIAADKQKQTQCSSKASVVLKPNENIEKAADLLMGVFRVCVTDVRATAELSKRRAIINIINQLFKIYFRINKIHLCKPLIRALENANIHQSQISLAQQVTYNYFIGIKELFDSNYKKAEQLLGFAFTNCYKSSFKNKRLILIFLIPVKMLLGHMPTKNLLEKYQLHHFEAIAKAVKDGNLKGLDDALERNSDFFWNFGIYLILEKLKIIAYRNLFKKVSTLTKTHQIPIECFKVALRFIQQEDITLEEVHCILANLIFEGKIKGYISLQHQKLVVSKQNPFPTLATIAS